MANSDYTSEIWKTIPFAPTYAVSDCGRVKRLITSGMGNWKAGHVLTPSDSRGYLAVVLTMPNGKLRTFKVHQLVLRTFVGEPPPDHVGAHEDGNRINNRLANLSWKTPAENAADRARHNTNLPGSRNGFSKLTEDMVREIRAISGVPHREIALRFGVSLGTVRQIRYRTSWTHI